MDTQKQNGAVRLVKAVFPHTIPVMTGYVFMGMAFGILLASKGYGPGWAFLMAVIIFAGSAQFVAVGLLAAGFDVLNAMLIILMVNARHIFYGIGMLERFKQYGWLRAYMIFALTDETFALLNATKPPPGISEEKFGFTMALMNQSYWVLGCTAGGFLGTALPINTQGIDFVMTALFTVVFLEQWQNRKNRTPALIGLAAALACRLLFGPQWFILASMAALVVVFSLTRPLLEERGHRDV